MQELYDGVYIRFTVCLVILLLLVRDRIFWDGIIIRVVFEREKRQIYFMAFFIFGICYKSKGRQPEPAKVYRPPSLEHGRGFYRILLFQTS